MHVRYNGPHRHIWQEWNPTGSLDDEPKIFTVSRGEVIEVPDELGAHLLEQGTYSKAAAPKEDKPADQEAKSEPETDDKSTKADVTKSAKSV